MVFERFTNPIVAEFQVEAATHVEVCQAVFAAINLAKAADAAVSFEVNRVKLVVRKDSDSDQVISKYRQEREAQRLNLEMISIEGTHCTFKVTPQSEIFDCCRDAVEYARSKNVDVLFSFNGIEVRANRMSEADSLADQYQAQLVALLNGAKKESAASKLMK